MLHDCKRLALFPQPLHHRSIIGLVPVQHLQERGICYTARVLATPERNLMAALVNLRAGDLPRNLSPANRTHIIGISQASRSA